MGGSDLLSNMLPLDHRGALPVLSLIISTGIEANLIVSLLPYISGKIPRINQHILYVGLVENKFSPTTHRGAVRKDGSAIP